MVGWKRYDSEKVIFGGCHNKSLSPSGVNTPLCHLLLKSRGNDTDVTWCMYPFCYMRIPSVLNAGDELLAKLNIFLPSAGDTYTLFWLFDINLRGKRNQRTWNSSGQWLGFRESLEQTLTGWWHLYCSRKNDTSCPFPLNRPKDTSEISNRWHSAVVTFHTRPNPSGFKGESVLSTHYRGYRDQNKPNRLPDEWVNLLAPSWVILLMRVCWNTSCKYISMKLESYLDFCVIQLHLGHPCQN